MHTAEVDITVPFHDVDMMEITWHGHYVKYLEIARCALLDNINYNYAQMRDSGYAWPIIDMRLRYPAPSRFGQIITVKAKIKEWENRLKIDYEIRDKDSGQRLTRGYTVQVAVDIESKEMLLESPKILFDRLGIRTS